MFHQHYKTIACTNTFEQTMAAIAPMETAPKDGDRVIPLECFLCPRKPKFSDISHLLTHVSSKSHLHQQFNMGLRAKTDPVANDKLRRFQQWYQAYGIENLLEERMQAKTQKKASRRSRGHTTTVSGLLILQEDGKSLLTLTTRRNSNRLFKNLS